MTLQLNARETMIKQGYSVMLIICGLLLANALIDLVSSGIGGLSLIIFAFIAWLCWSLYSGRIWARYLLGFYALRGVLGGIFLFFGGMVAGESFYFLMSALNFIISGVVIYLLFLYEPVQMYLRYIGGQVE